jgi:hypothetical protein
MRTFHYRLRRLESQPPSDASPLVVWMRDGDTRMTAMAHLGLTLEEVEGRPLLFVQYAPPPVTGAEEGAGDGLTL